MKVQSVLEISLSVPLKCTVLNYVAYKYTIILNGSIDDPISNPMLRASGVPYITSTMAQLSSHIAKLASAQINKLTNLSVYHNVFQAIHIKVMFGCPPHFCATTCHSFFVADKLVTTLVEKVG